MDRVWPLLSSDQPIATAFGHRGKAAAIEHTWASRAGCFARFQSVSGDTAKTLEWCAGLPWIGPITKYHLAKNLGCDVAKPDRWLVRLADAEAESVDSLCVRLSEATGDRIATVDVVLWRACAVGRLRSGAPAGHMDQQRRARGHDPRGRGVAREGQGTDVTPRRNR